jgi:hypothetical protein
MCLYGTKPVVQQLSKEVKKIDDEYKPILCNVQLTSNQVRNDCLISFIIFSL